MKQKSAFCITTFGAGYDPESAEDSVRAAAKTQLAAVPCDGDWRNHIAVEVTCTAAEIGEWTAWVWALDADGERILERAMTGGSNKDEPIIALLAECREVLAGIVCRCDAAFISRGQHAPNSLCHLHDPLLAAVDRVRRSGKT